MPPGISGWKADQLLQLGVSFRKRHRLRWEDIQKTPCVSVGKISLQTHWSYGRRIWLEGSGRREQLPNVICRICCSIKAWKIASFCKAVQMLPPQGNNPISPKSFIFLFSSTGQGSSVCLKDDGWTTSSLPGDGGFVLNISFRTSKTVSENKTPRHKTVQRHKEKSFVLNLGIRYGVSK